jgi:hypothetical protein
MIKKMINEEDGLTDGQFKNFLKKKGISFAGFIAKANEAKKTSNDKKEGGK